MVNYLKLARKIAEANAPPTWMRNRAEWQALQAIVGGWLATTSVIKVPDTASGFAIVDNETGQRRSDVFDSERQGSNAPVLTSAGGGPIVTNIGQHPMNVLGKAVQPGESAAADAESTAALQARAPAIAEKLTKVQWLGLAMVARGDRVTMSARVRETLKVHGLINAYMEEPFYRLTPLGVEVAKVTRQ